MKNISKFLSLKDIVKSYGGNTPAKETPEIEALIEDIMFELDVEDQIVTKRIYKNAEKIFKLKSDDAVKALDQYAKYLKDNNITETIDEEWVENYLTEVKARAPKLFGRAAKAREAKAKVMKELNKDDQFNAAKNRLMTIANRKAKQIARELGVQPNLVNVDKITVRKSD